MNCWNLWKLWASRFHLQLASLEMDLNRPYTCGVGVTQPAAEPTATASAQRYGTIDATSVHYDVSRGSGMPGHRGQLTTLKFGAKVRNCMWRLCYFCVAS